MRFLILLVLATVLSAEEVDLFTGLQYIDGQTRTKEFFADRSYIALFFCGHCPSAAKFVRETMPTVCALVAEAKQPVRLVIVSPDKDVAGMAAYAKELKLDSALIASDPANRLQISLNNILGGRMQMADGRKQYLKGGDEGIAQVKEMLARKDLGTPVYPMENLTDPTVRSLWWDLELSRPSAVATLLAGVKQAKKEPAKTEMTTLMTAVATATATKRDALVAADPSLEAYENLEAFLTANAGLDLKAGTERLKVLAKDPTLKDELAARAAWLKVQPLLGSKKPSEQKSGAESLAAIAKRFPDTVYGKRAAGAQ